MVVVTNSAGQSEPFSGSMIPKLLQCDHVSGFRDRGWYCIAGFVDGNRSIFAHADSFDDIRSSFALSGYRFDGSSILEMTQAEKDAFEDEWNAKSDYPLTW
jgi:hypothetical protein